MLCYLDRSFCSVIDCGNMECVRNQCTIDTKKYEEVGLPLSISDFSTSCSYYLNEGVTGGEGVFDE